MNLVKKALSANNSNPVFDHISMTLLRVFTGLTMALAHGMGKLPPPEQMTGALESMGFPMPGISAWAAALAEVVGGILLAIGLLTRPAAAFMAFTMFIAAFVVHSADPFQKKELALLYLVISLFFVFKGSGNWSVDAKIGKN